jgi:hypothetical protein
MSDAEQAPAATAAETLTPMIDEPHGHPIVKLGAISTYKLSLKFEMGPSTHRENGTHDGLDVGVTLAVVDAVGIAETDGVAEVEGVLDDVGIAERVAVVVVDADSVGVCVVVVDAD